MGVVADLADRVAVMLEGEIVETAPRARRCSPRRSTTTPSSCSRPCRTSEIARPVSCARPTDGPAGARVGRRGQGPRDRVPGSLRARRLPRRRRRELHDRARARSSASSARSRLGQDDDRPRHRRAHPVAGGSLRVLGTEMLGVQERDVPPAAQASIGFVFQDPASSFNPLLTIARVRRRAAHRPRVARRTPRPRAQGRRAARGRAAPARLRRPLSRTSSPAASASGPRLARALALDPKLLIADEPT